MRCNVHKSRDNLKVISSSILPENSPQWECNVHKSQNRYVLLMLNNFKVIFSLQISVMHKKYFDHNTKLLNECIE